VNIHPSLKRQGGIPLIILGVGNVLAYLGSLEDAKNFVKGTIGLRFLPYLFVAIAAVLLLGYIAVFAFMMRSIPNREDRKDFNILAFCRHSLSRSASRSEF
jgi:hypothetical protein